jgi:flagellin-specific chaperone FliS
MEAVGSRYVGNIVLWDYAASIFRKVNHILNMEAAELSETLEHIYQTE